MCWTAIKNLQKNSSDIEYIFLPQCCGDRNGLITWFGLKAFSFRWSKHFSLQFFVELIILGHFFYQLDFGFLNSCELTFNSSFLIFPYWAGGMVRSNVSVVIQDSIVGIDDFYWRNINQINFLTWLWSFIHLWRKDRKPYLWRPPFQDSTPLYKVCIQESACNILGSRQSRPTCNRVPSSFHRPKSCFYINCFRIKKNYNWWFDINP